MDAFLANPTIRETTQTHANTFINSIDVNGFIYASTIDNIVVDDILSDVVYKHEPAPKITSFKRFASLESPDIQVTSNLINDIPFSSFVTRDTQQTFNVSNLHANVFFQHLKLDGLFNFVNITDLDMDSIKLVGDQFTNAELVFENGDQFNIEADEIVVLDTVNDINVCNYDYVSVFNFGRKVWAINNLTVKSPYLSIIDYSL